MKLQLQPDMEALVIGAGASGISAIKLLLSKGFTVRLLEYNPHSLSDEILQFLADSTVPVLYGECTTHHCEQVDFIVLSPGVPVKNIYEVLPLKNAPIVLGEIELAYTFLNDEQPIIAITGTAGKTTTASLTASILEHAGLSVFLGGNIGTPFSEYIMQEKKADVIVLELSSFQLQTIHYFHPKVAVLLNISPNHLDYHKDMEEYIEAKINIFRRQNKDDFALLGEQVQNYISTDSIPSVIRYCHDEHRFTPFYLLGKHNAENIEFAYQACRIFGVSQECARTVINSYKSLPHRLELVHMKHGISYINDSKSTTVESLFVALEAIPEPIILLAGGKFKGGDLLSVRKLLEQKVKHIVLFGASKDIFLAGWSGTTTIDYFTTLAEAVQYAKTIAQYGDTVLLSPATSSFDAFRSYIERGEAFRTAVLNLPEGV